MPALLLWLWLIKIKRHLELVLPLIVFSSGETFAAEVEECEYCDEGEEGFHGVVPFERRSAVRRHRLDARGPT